MEWMGMSIPCMLEDTRNLRLGADFTIKALIKPDIIGGKQSILSKRVPVSKGDRPGIIILLHGSCVEFMTFAAGDKGWITARTIPKVIMVGQKYEILTYRAGNEARIYVNGIDRTNPKYNKASPGDIDCDMYAFVGMQLYNSPTVEREPFVGKIFMVGMYQDKAYFDDAKSIRFQQNPNIVRLDAAKDVISKRHPVLAEKLKIRRS